MHQMPSNSHIQVHHKGNYTYRSGSISCVSLSVKLSLLKCGKVPKPNSGSQQTATSASEGQPDIPESTIFLSDLMSAEHKGTKHPKEKKPGRQKGGEWQCAHSDQHRFLLTFCDISETLYHKCFSVCIIPLGIWWKIKTSVMGNL